MEDKRTTKYVTATVSLTFHGDYLDAGDVRGYAEGWIDAGLEDRDDLRGWRITWGEVTEVSGDPEGFDS